MSGGKQMNKFYMNGKLIHKAFDHNTKRCEVEKWVFLPHSDFERLDMLIRKLIECVRVVSKTEITIIFKGGIRSNSGD
jgi:hypothetical protein